MKEFSRVLAAVDVSKAASRLANGAKDLEAVATVRADIAPRNAAIRSLMDLVQAEYAEMPGLSVTLPQAQRLWAVNQATCEEVFSRLVARGVLRMTTRGRFVRG